MKSILLFGLFLINSVVFCQEFGTIRFGIELDEQMDIDKRYFEIQLEDTLLINQSIVELPTGLYEGFIWSPGFETQEIQFEIKPNENTDLLMKMERTVEYLAYRQEMPLYLKKGKRFKRAPLIFMVLCAGGTIFATERMTSFQRKLFQGEYDYQYTTSVRNMILLKDEMRLNTIKYNQYRTFFYTGLAATGVALIGSIWSARYFKRKIPKPYYNKESPFQNKLGLEIGIGRINLTWNI